MTRPTLASLAAGLGVSRQTVSNVINAPHLVKETTRERVAAKIKETGYRPSAAGRALRSQRSLVLAMRMYPLSDGINGAVMDAFWHHVVEQTQANGYRIMMFTARDSAQESEILQRLYLTGAIDGALLTGTYAGDEQPAFLTENRIPFGAFGRPWGDDAAQHRWVDVDGAAGVREATQHLAAQGFRRIGFVGWPSTSGVGDDRRAGWRDVVSGLVPADEVDSLHCSVEDGVAHGIEGVEQLLAAGIDAVVCASDSLAVGAIEAVRRTDRRIPVIGFDDTPVARAIGLTSIRQPVEQAAELLVRGILHDLGADHAGDDNRHVLLAPSLEVREGILA